MSCLFNSSVQWVILFGIGIYRGGVITMEMTLHNKAMQPISQFAIQLNKNSFGVCPASPLHVPAPLAPNQSIDVSLTLATTGPVQRMDPLTNLQVCSHCPIVQKSVCIRNMRVQVLSIESVTLYRIILSFRLPLRTVLMCSTLPR